MSEQLKSKCCGARTKEQRYYETVGKIEQRCYETVCTKCGKPCEAVEPPKFGGLSRKEFMALSKDERFKQLQDSAIKFAQENPS
jgi:hypothetical protein